MELDLSNVAKQMHLSKAVLKNIPNKKVLTIQGEGDPMKTFDEKLSRLHEYLEKNNIEVMDKPSFGIYYKNRGEIGVENVIWDACVEINSPVKGTDKLIYKEFPNQVVLSTILTGGYNLIGDAVHYLEKVAEGSNLEIKWELTEVYIKEGKHPITELWFPIVES